MATQKIETGLIADSAVTTAKLADNSVTAAKIAAGSLDDQVKGISSSADAVAITIDSSENVGIGTDSPSSYNSNADNLVIAGSGNTGLTIAAGTLDDNNIFFSDGTSGDAAYRGIFRYNHADDAFKFYTAGANQRMTIDSSGNVGIGTTSPTVALEVGDGTATANWLRLNGTTSDLYIGQNTGFSHFGQTNATKILSVSNHPLAYGTANAYPLIFGTSDTERMRIDSSGNVSIGTTNANNRNLYIQGAGGYIGLNSTTGGFTTIEGFDNGTKRWRIGQAGFGGADGFAIYTGASDTERLRVDSSGNLLVGKTSQAVETTGSEVGDGFIAAARNGTVGFFNRQSSDGEITRFSKDGSTVGSIGSRGGAVSYIVLDPRASGAGLTATNDAILPSDETGNPVNNNTDLGTSSIGFKDLYLSGGAYLGGTGSANHLDDYEEGTFTPTLQNGTFTYSTQGGFYTKIGRMVTLNIFIKWTAKSGSGAVVFSNFPFTSINSISYRATGSLGYTAGLDFSTGTEAAYVALSGNDTNAQIWLAKDNASPIASDVSALSSSGELQLTITYITD